MPRPALEVQDIFRDHGPGFRRARAGRLSLGQLKVMSAIECCRTAALGGHVAACEDCGQNHIAYNSCRNRHCPKCQGQVAREWLAAREAELLSVPYYHLVFTLPAAIADIAYQNKSVIYDILFKASAETMLTIAADPKHLGAKIGITAVLHTWGSAMTHHPHIHMIVPGGGISPDGSSWISCRPGFFLPVRVLSRLFRRLFIEKLLAAHEAGRLKLEASPSRRPSVSSSHRCANKNGSSTAPSADQRPCSPISPATPTVSPSRTAAWSAATAKASSSPTTPASPTPMRKQEWVVYAKPPFGGPEAVLAYLSRYTHRVAISNSRLVSCDSQGVIFKYKDYRRKGRERYKTLPLAVPEFIRRFLLHVLPSGFHRIRHYGLFANGGRTRNISLARELLAMPAPESEADDAASDDDTEPPSLSEPCPQCGGRMIVIERFEAGAQPRAPPRARPLARATAA